MELMNISDQDHTTVDNGAGRTRCTFRTATAYSVPRSGGFSRPRSIAVAIPLLFMLLRIPASACDFCNCLMGINPFFSENDWLSLHVLFQNSLTTPIDDLSGDHGSGALLSGPNILELGPLQLHHGGAETGPSREYRRTFELSYQYHFSRNLMATAILPYVDSRIEGSSNITVRGLGDLTLLAHYVIPDLFGGGSPSTLQLGAGIDLPTGAHQLKDERGEQLDSRLQPGSGTVDGVLNATMTVQFDAWTCSADLFSRLNTTDANDNRIGSSLAATAAINRDIYRNNADGFAVVGIGGVRQEIAGKDKVAGETDPDSGYSTTYASLGGEVLYSDLRFDATAMIPLHQSRDAGAPQERTRVVLGLGYNF